jgi:hypothetical protein
MLLSLILFLGVFLVGLIGGYFVNLILKRFQAKFRLYLKELKENNPHFKTQPYQDISRQQHSLSYVGENIPRFLVIILSTSILEAIINFISKGYVESFSYFTSVALAFYMVLRLPLLIEFFVRRNLYEASNILRSMRKSDIIPEKSVKNIV